MPNTSLSLGWGQRKPPFGSRVSRRAMSELGIQGCWLANEGGGTNLYDSARNNTAVWGGSAFQNLWVGGNHGMAVDCGVRLRYARATCPIQATTTPFTISVWCKPNQSSSRTCVSVCDNFGSGNRYLIYATGGIFQIYTQTGGTAAFVGPTYAFTSNQWYHVVASIDSNVTLWVNGVNAGSGSNINGFAAATYFAMGTDWDNSFPNFWDGQLGTGMIFSKRLTDAQVLKLYRDPYWYIDQPGPRFQPRASVLVAGKMTGITTLSGINSITF